MALVKLITLLSDSTSLEIDKYTQLVLPLIQKTSYFAQSLSIDAIPIISTLL